VSAFLLSYPSTILVTVGSAPDPNGPFAGFLCNVTGSVTYTDLQGRSSTITAIAGIIYPIAIKAITANGTGGTVYGCIGSSGVLP
jgi:hypothetical protein